MQLDGPGFAPLSGGKAAYLVVLLHGVGARPGLGHAIDDAGIALAGDFLRDVLKAARDDTGVAV